MYKGKEPVKGGGDGEDVESGGLEEGKLGEDGEELEAGEISEPAAQAPRPGDDVGWPEDSALPTSDDQDYNFDDFYLDPTINDSHHYYPQPDSSSRPPSTSHRNTTPAVTPHPEYSLNDPPSLPTRIRHVPTPPAAVPSAESVPSSSQAFDTEMSDSTGVYSGDSDAVASHMMKTPTVHSRKASNSFNMHRRATSIAATPSPGYMSGNSSEESPIAGTSTSATTASSSRKRQRPATVDPVAEVTSTLKGLSNTLTQQIQESSATKEETKRLKIEARLASKELKARTARDEREHNLRVTLAAQDHERAMADENRRKLELEIQLEKMRKERIAMERGWSPNQAGPST